MKCLSLWQPWASAVALGSKRIETRSWRTHYTGPLLIHAAKRRMIGELIHYSCCTNWASALAALIPIDDDKRWYDKLPFGAIVGVVDLFACRPTHDLRLGEINSPRHQPGESSPEYHNWSEQELGDFGPDRFAWMLENPKHLRKPIPFRGRQGLFNVPDSLLIPSESQLKAMA